MISEYINAALKNADYEIIEDEEPYYGEIPELKGIWVTGKTLEECRGNLTENLEGWILVRNSQGMDIPAINGYMVITPKEMKVA
ncbi:MAG: type II toxin-antitoxin system HicB family antitoxin [Methylococcaceae bacterium]